MNPTAMACTANAFASLAVNLFWPKDGNLPNVASFTSKTFLRRFSGLFGCSPLICSKLWSLLQLDGYLNNLAAGKQHPRHLLWALLFLKQYNPEEVNSQMCHCDEKTYRKWVWIVVKAIAELSCLVSCRVPLLCFCTVILHTLLVDCHFSLLQIKWSNRNQFHNPNGRCRVSVDGTDFEIREPQPFDRQWYSHKFKGPGVRYEVVVAIATGWIVRINGPFACGGFLDLRVANLPGGLIDDLDDDEMFVADRGYAAGCLFSVTPNGLNNAQQRLQKDIRARHENVNAKFKEWSSLANCFRHDPHRHHYQVFMSVANITQLKFFHTPMYDVF
jgi:hypothetical protein